MDIVKGQDAGFTLIEVVLALILVGIMATVAAMGLVSFARGYVTVKENTHTTQKAQLAMGRLKRELTELSDVSAGSDATTISFESRESQSGDRHIGLDNGAVKIVDSNAGLSTGDVLVDNVESFTISYYQDYQEPQQFWVPGTDDIDLLTVIRVELALKGVGGKLFPNRFSEKHMKTSLIKTLREDQKGVVFIGLIVVMIIFASLGAAMISMSITSAYNKVWSGRTSRVYYLAESGFRYARAEYQNVSDTDGDGFTRDDRNQKLIDWHSPDSAGDDVLFTFSGTEGKFELKSHPYFLVTSVPHIAGADRVTARFPGEQPSGFPIQTQTPGKLKIGTDPLYTIIAYGYDSGTEIHTFFLSPTLQSAVSDKMDVYMIADPASDGQVLSKGAALALADASLFPEQNGVFRVEGGDGTVYAYKSKDVDTDALQGIFDVEDPDRTFSVNVGTTDDIIIYPFLELHSIGIIDYDSDVETRRQITFNVPLTTDEARRLEFKDTFEDLSKWETSTLGSHAAADPEGGEGDKALTITGTDTVGASDVGSLIELNWSETNIDLNRIHQQSDNFLSYDDQVKVGFSPLPSSYAAGISFRLDADNNNFGLSFMRGEDDPNDGIPDEIVPVVDTPLIVLWQQTSSGTTQEWLAYSGVPDSGSLSDDVEGGEKGWITRGVPTPDGLWHISNYQPPGSSGSGGSAWYYAQKVDPPGPSDYDTPLANAGNLISFPVNLCTATSATLNFWSWYETEPDPSNLNNSDIKWVDVSTDYGNSWTSVFQITLPDHPMSTWELITVPLSAYVGNAIRIRFRFDTVDNVNNNFEGWYVDDIEITSDAVFSINESTLTVRVQEAASIAFSNGSNGAGIPGIEAGDVIQGGTSLESAQVVHTPIIASGAWDDDNAAGTLLLQNVTGTFTDGEPLSVVGPSAAVATAVTFTAKANFIRAYYGNPVTCGTPNDDPLDDQKHGNPRNGEINWPPDEVQNWAAVNDYFRLVQWDVARVTGEVPAGQEVSSLSRIASVDEPDAILMSTESDLLSPLISGAFTQAELGLHTFGVNSTAVYFDDFALQADLFSTGQFLSPIQQ